MEDLRYWLCELVELCEDLDINEVLQNIENYENENGISIITKRLKDIVHTMEDYQ